MPLTLIARSPLAEIVVVTSTTFLPTRYLKAGAASLSVELREYPRNCASTAAMRASWSSLLYSEALNVAKSWNLPSLKLKSTGTPAGFSGVDQVFAIAEADLAAVVTEREAVVAAIRELTGHLEEAALPDLHDGEQARIEGVVHATGIADVDGAPRRARQRAALQAHFVADQPLHGVGERVVRLRGRERGELRHRTAARADR